MRARFVPCAFIVDRVAPIDNEDVTWTLTEHDAAYVRAARREGRDADDIIFSGDSAVPYGVSEWDGPFELYFSEDDGKTEFQL